MQPTEQQPQSDTKTRYSVNIYSVKTDSGDTPEHILCEEYDTIEDAQTRLHRLYYVNAIDQWKL